MPGEDWKNRRYLIFSGRRGERRVKAAHIVLLLFGLVILYAIAYSLAFTIGPSYFGDDVAYAQLAYFASHGVLTQNGYIFSVRILNVLPIAFFYKVMGITILSSAMWSIICYIATVIITFYLGKELYDERVGVLAAGLITVFPLIMKYTTTLSDNVPMMFFASFAMLALIIGERRKSGKWYFLSGVLMVMAPLATPTGAEIIVVGVLYILVEVLRKRIVIDRTLMHFVYGLIVAGGVLMAYNYFTSGNPLITYTVNENYFSSVGGPNTIPEANMNLSYYPNEMFPYRVLSVLASSAAELNLNPFSIWSQIYTFNYNDVGFFFYAFVISAVYLIVRKVKQAYFALFWFFAGFLYLEFGPMHIGLIPFTYLLSHRLERYLLLITVPLVVTIAIAIIRLIDNASARFRPKALVISVVSVVFLVTTAIPVGAFWYTQMHYEGYDMAAIAGYLSVFPNSTTVYMESGYGLVQFFMQYSNLSRFYVYDDINSCTEIPAGSFVIIPKYDQVFGLSYTPTPESYCNWTLVYNPQINGTYPAYITNPAEIFEAKVYKVN